MKEKNMKKMTEAKKNARILAIDKKMCQLAKEYFELVAPTEDEIKLCIEMYMDDSKDAAAAMWDASGPIGMWNLAGEAICLREEKDAEEKDAEEKGR